MTANELADLLAGKLEGHGVIYVKFEYRKQAAAMLRQQQAEIEALKLRELTDEEIKAVYGKYFDVKNFDWLHLECIQAILRKAQEK